VHTYTIGTVALYFNPSTIAHPPLDPSALIHFMIQLFVLNETERNTLLLLD